MKNRKAIIGITALALILVSVLSVSILNGNLAIEPQQQNEQPNNLNGSTVSYCFEIRLAYIHKTEINETATSHTQKVSLYNEGNNIIPNGLTWVLTVESEGYYFTDNGKTETLKPDSTQLLSVSEITVIVLGHSTIHKGVGVTYTLTINGITETLTYYL